MVSEVNGMELISVESMFFMLQVSRTQPLAGGWIVFGANEPPEERLCFLETNRRQVVCFCSFPMFTLFGEKAC